MANALDQLLMSLHLSQSDITQLRDNTITLHELISRHLASIAWTDEIERRSYLKSEQQLPEIELDPTQALDNLRCEIADALMAHETDSDIRTKIPLWITWEMLRKWVEEYDIQRIREADQLAAILDESRHNSETWEMDYSAGGYAEPSEENAFPV